MATYTYYGNKNEHIDGTAVLRVASGDIDVGSSGDFTTAEYNYFSQHYDLRSGVVPWHRTDFPWQQDNPLSHAAPGVTPTQAPSIVSAPTISGTNQSGQTLTASHGTWSNSPTSYSYQWQRSANSGSTWTNISAATASTYVLQSADVGDIVRCAVTATNGVGSNTANSSATSTITAGASTPLKNAILGLSPKYYWRLNESSGTSATDSGPNGKTGTYTGNYTHSAGNLSADTDGNSAGIDLNQTGAASITFPNSGIPSAQPFSVVALIKMTATTGNNQRLFSNGAGGANGWSFGINTAGDLLLTFYGAADEPGAASSVALNTILLVGFTYDGTNLNFYVGATNTNTINVSAVTLTATSDSVAAIGTDSGGADQFVGQISDVAVFDKVLSGANFTTINSAV